MNSKRKIYVYLVTQNDAYQLPLGCFSSIRRCAKFLDCLPTTCSQFVNKGTAIKEKYLLFKVQI